jgi:hypothetical protein
MPRHNLPAFLSYQYLQYENQRLSGKCNELMETVKILQQDMECMNSFIMSKYDMSGSNVTCVMTDMSGNFIPCLHRDICGNSIPCIMTPAESAYQASPRDFPHYGYSNYDSDSDDDYERAVHGQHLGPLPVNNFSIPPLHPMHPPSNDFTASHGETSTSGGAHPMHEKDRGLFGRWPHYYHYPYPYPYPRPRPRPRPRPYPRPHSHPHPYPYY